MKISEIIEQVGYSSNGNAPAMTDWEARFAIYKALEAEAVKASIADDKLEEMVRVKAVPLSKIKELCGVEGGSNED